MYIFMQVSPGDGWSVFRHAWLNGARITHHSSIAADAG